MLSTKDPIQIKTHTHTDWKWMIYLSRGPEVINACLMCPTYLLMSDRYLKLNIVKIKLLNFHHRELISPLLNTRLPESKSSAESQAISLLNSLFTFISSPTLALLSLNLEVTLLQREWCKSLDRSVAQPFRCVHRIMWYGILTHHQDHQLPQTPFPGIRWHWGARGIFGGRGDS